MNLFVLDASVLAKCFLPSHLEPHFLQAIGLIEKFRKNHIQLIEPDFAWAEIGSVFLKSVRRGVFTEAAAKNALRELHKLDIDFAPSAALIETAFVLAHRHDRSVYDCLYLALAIAVEAEFITADEKLCNAIAGKAPVKWLGAISL